MYGNLLSSKTATYLVQSTCPSNRNQMLCFYPKRSSRIDLDSLNPHKTKRSYFTAGQESGAAVRHNLHYSKATRKSANTEGAG